MTMRKPLDAEAMYRTILSNPEKLPVQFTLDGRAREGLEAEVFRRGAEKETRADGVNQAEICFELRGEKPLTARLLLEWDETYGALAFVLAPLTRVALFLTGFFVPRHESEYRLTTADLVRILQDRKDGVCLSDIESALVSRIIVLRVKGKAITPEAILSALREVD